MPRRIRREAPLQSTSDGLKVEYFPIAGNFPSWRHRSKVCAVLPPFTTAAAAAVPASAHRR